MPKFEKGKPRPENAGRKKGSLNKFTTLKQSFLDAYNSKEYGGTQGLIEGFTINPFTKREFAKLISKMLPTNVDTEVSGEISIVVKKILTDVRPEE